MPTGSLKRSYHLFGKFRRKLDEISITLEE